jgi:hypothetical protein
MRLDGTFTVRGDRVIFDFQGVGRSTFHWTFDEDHYHRLTLDFISADPGTTIAGAPAEAALRMLLTAAPLGGTGRVWNDETGQWDIVE